jgi:DNA-binding transcriptional LysR family regulator
MTGNRKVTLTAAGQSFLGEATDVLAAVDRYLLSLSCVRKLKSNRD